MVKVMVILCDLAWKGEAAGGGDGEDNVLRPQIAMMIKKQLDNRSDLLKKKGAIGTLGITSSDLR